MVRLLIVVCTIFFRLFRIRSFFSSCKINNKYECECAVEWWSDAVVLDFFFFSFSRPWFFFCFIHQSVSPFPLHTCTATIRSESIFIISFRFLPGRFEIVHIKMSGSPHPSSVPAVPSQDDMSRLSGFFSISIFCGCSSLYRSESRCEWGGALLLYHFSPFGRGFWRNRFRAATEHFSPILTTHTHNHEHDCEKTGLRR